MEKCLDSVKNQILQDIEIICVDDGSTDGSLEIINRYARQDSRFKVIHKENGGLVSARKAGIALASGQYVGYVDSDDWIEPKMYQVLYRTAVENHADLVSSGYFLKGTISRSTMMVSGKGYMMKVVWTISVKTRFMIRLRRMLVFEDPCAASFFAQSLFRTVQQEISEKLSFSEDKVCVFSYVLQCSRVYVLKQAFYHYIAHPSSMVHAADTNYLACVNEIYQSFVKLYEHPAFTRSMRVQAEPYITEQLYKGINSRLGFVNSSLFWLDPYYLGDIPQGARIALYGGGDLGCAYRRQLMGRKDLELAGCVDPAYESMRYSDFTVYSPEKLRQWEYDLVLITVKNPEKAAAIKKELVEAGVSEKKIRWYEQKEIFWKYAKVNGWFA